MNKYFFILGNNPGLSVAEIISWLDNNTYDYKFFSAQPEFIIVEIDKELPLNLLYKLGGTIKFGRIISNIKGGLVTEKFIMDTIKPNLGSGKFNFGFSVYPLDKNLLYKLRGFGLKTKKQLKAQQISVRLVMSQTENLSSVTVAKNKLLGEKGMELVFLKNEKDFIIGRSLAVQPFEKLSKRDYGRPRRDDFSGMLPPKLAQIMINLAKPGQDDLVIDPFCGSGTILQEALLLGYENLIGADISKKAIANTKENLEWLEQNHKINMKKLKLHVTSIETLTKQISAPVDLIITEPYLGPPVKGYRNMQKTQEVISELTKLYSDAFNTFSKILKSGGMVVMVWPVFSSDQGDKYLPLVKIVDNKLFQLQKVLPSNLENIYQHSTRNTLMYTRDQQKVKREIMVFKNVT